MFMFEMLKVQKKKHLPLVISVSNKEKGTTMVLGLKKQSEDFTVKK
jgi:hypothetical protein